MVVGGEPLGSIKQFSNDNAPPSLHAATRLHRVRRLKGAFEGFGEKNNHVFAAYYRPPGEEQEGAKKLLELVGVIKLGRWRFISETLLLCLTGSFISPSRDQSVCDAQTDAMTAQK